MIRSIILWFLGYARLALLAGLGLLGMAGYTAYSASQGGKIPPEAELTVQSGHIVEGREVTVERQRRRGGRSTSLHYELDLKPASGEIITLKLDHAVPRQALEATVDEKVTVKYDPEDDNTTYVIQHEGQDLLPYAQMAALSQSRADEDRELFAAPGMIGFALLLALLGGGGMALQRKMLAQA